MKKGVKAEFPTRMNAMLATLVKEPFQNEEWLYEVKWDGYRVISHIRKGTVILYSRSHQNYTNNYPIIVEALRNIKNNAILDGELVVLDERGRPSFDELQRYDARLPILYYVFDILWLDSYSLIDLPLIERKQILQEILPTNDFIKYSDHFEDGLALFEQAKKMELEGIVAKRKASLYFPGQRSKDWLKIQTSKREEFVVGGWTESENNKLFRSLLFGWYINKKLYFVGHAGHGFKQKDMREILEKLKRLEINQTPFVNNVDAETRVHWVKPQLVIDVKYSTFTRVGKIRKPAIFMGFRNDKKPTEVTREHTQQLETPATNQISPKIRKKVSRRGKSNQKMKADSTSKNSNWPIIEKQKITSQETFSIEGHNVTLTNVEKGLWEGVTKADLIKYYHSISEYILVHLKDRPLSLHIKHIRPTVEGIYIKDMEGRQPDFAEIFTVERKHKKQGTRDMIDYLVCNNLATLVYIINLGCVDVNPWTSTTNDYLHPDYIIIDLDPSDDDFKKAIKAAKAAKRVFDRYKIVAFPKTSGKTGIHLYIPCVGFTFSEARRIAENLCGEIHQMIPDITTTNVSVNQRGSKLYLDPNQNDEGDTVAAPYSVRPYKFPTVSIPLEWGEITSELNPNDFTVDTVAARLKTKGDLSKHVLSNKIRLTNTKNLKEYLKNNADY